MPWIIPFEETTMKNMPIDQFWSFKWRNGVQNWNLQEKLSKIGLLGNFDFWLKVNAKSQSQLVQGQSQQILVQIGFGFLGRVTDRATDPLTSSYDASLTWTRVDLEVLARLLTWSDDVSSRFQRVAGVWVFHRHMEEKLETQVARGDACNSGWKSYFFRRQIGGRHCW